MHSSEDMYHIVIISPSIRKERNSHRVALFFKNYLLHHQIATCEILDLREYNFPLFTERLKYQDSPSKATLDFAGKIKSADGVIIVAPEYNGGYTASLKNAIDLLIEEWRRKPVAISTVSNGPFGGNQVIISLQFSLWKMHAWTVPVMFPVTRILESFDVDGNPFDKEAVEKRAGNFINEILWCIEAKNRML
jgi:NAD(P)H-dependent FMN reductase